MAPCSPHHAVTAIIPLPGVSHSESCRKCTCLPSVYGLSDVLGMLAFVYVNNLSRLSSSVCILWHPRFHR